MKLVNQYSNFLSNFLKFFTFSSHLHPLQVENCDSNSRLVVDEDDNGKFRRLERVNYFSAGIDYRRQILRSKADPRAERVKVDLSGITNNANQHIINLSSFVMKEESLQIRPLGYGRVYLPLCIVADTPYHI